MRLSEFDGAYFRVVRDGSFDSLCNITTVTDIGCLSFATDERFIKRACAMPHISCLAVPEELADHPVLLASGKGIAAAKDPKYAFQRLHNELIKNRDARYVPADFDTVVGAGSIVDSRAVIADKNVRIGRNVTIEPYAIIKEGVTIEDDCIIMAGAILGQGACLAGRDPEGNLYPLLSAGSVRVGRSVHVGSYSGINKGMFPYEETRIGARSLIGFAADISHNNSVGENVLVLDQCQLCGNVVTGNGAKVAPHSVVSNRLTLGAGAVASIGAVVVNNVGDGVKVAGNFAIEDSKFLLWHRNKLRTK